MHVIALLLIVFFFSSKRADSCGANDECFVNTYCQMVIDRSSGRPRGNCVPVNCNATGGCPQDSSCLSYIQTCIPNYCNGFNCPRNFVCNTRNQCIAGVNFCGSGCTKYFYCLANTCTPIVCTTFDDCFQFGSGRGCDSGLCQIPLCGVQSPPGCCRTTPLCTTTTTPPLNLSVSDFECNANNGFCQPIMPTMTPTAIPVSIGPTPPIAPSVPSQSPTPSVTLPPPPPPSQPTVSPTLDQDKLNVGIFLIIYVILLVGLLILFIGYRTYRKNATPK